MSGFLNNLRRFAVELRQEPVSRIPARVAGAVSGKLRSGSEQLMHLTGAGRVLARRYRGPGLVLMFHEIHEDVDGELRTGCSPGQLVRWVEAVRAAGRDIVSLDEALQRLAAPAARPFAVVTFDDGYRDNMSIALPLLERLDAPLTLFVPTGMVTRDLDAWWLGLRDLFKRHDQVEIAAMGHIFRCGDLPGKSTAMRLATDWIGTDPDRARAVGETFKRYAIHVPDLVVQYGMDAHALKTFAAHPLVTIGGHTTSHTWLARLDEAAANGEIAANKAFLEALLDRPVRHFAYPYGTAGACGLREARIAAAAGYKSAFTTRPGHIFADHLGNPHLMPRENAGIAHQSRAAMTSRLDGAYRAMETRFGSAVATTT